MLYGVDTYVQVYYGYHKNAFFTFLTGFKLQLLLHQLKMNEV